MIYNALFLAHRTRFTQRKRNQAMSQEILSYVHSIMSIVLTSKPFPTGLAGIDHFSCNGVRHCQQTK